MKNVSSITKATQEAAETIALAAKNAVITLANAAETATKTIASAAAEALKVSNTRSDADHDLLVKLNTKMETVQEAISKLSNKDDEYVLKEDFNSWRNIFITIGTILLTAVVGIIVKIITKGL